MCLIIEIKNWSTSDGVGKIESVVTAMDTKKEKLDFTGEFQVYYPILIKQVTFLMGDRNIAEDIVQETLIKYYYSDKKNIKNPRAWLTKVAINTSYNYIRSERSRKKREEATIQENDNTVEEIVIERQEAQRVREAIGLLSERDRLLILLKYTGYTYSEIAQTLEIEGNSVGTLLARAKKRFKDTLLSLKGSENNAY